MTPARIGAGRRQGSRRVLARLETLRTANGTLIDATHRSLLRHAASPDAILWTRRVHTLLARMHRELETAIRDGHAVLLALLLLSGATLACGPRPVTAPPSIPAPPAAAILRVEVFNGDPASDHKVPGAAVQIDDRPAVVTDGAGNVSVDVAVGVHRLTVAAAGYGAQTQDVTILTARTVPIALVPTIQRRHGVVRLDGHTFVDADGPFLGIGASLFWGVWGYRHDRVRLEQQLRFLAARHVDYIRVLAIVGPTAWTDRTVTPADLDALGGLIDLAADTYGLRTEVTIFGSVDTVPTPQDRQDVVRRVAGIVTARAQKTLAIEIGNESWQNGFSGAVGRDEARRLARLLRDLTPTLVAITSPESEATIDAWYGSSPATLMTVHPDRNITGQGGLWRPVRQAWDYRDSRIGWVNDEPIGPQSSVASDDDPLRLVMAAGLTWLCGGASYTAHAGAGIRGGGAEDRARGRVANWWEVAHVDETFAGLQALRSRLPRDLPNWTHHNSNSRFPGYPFGTAGLVPLLEANQLLRAFAATAPDGRFVVMPIVATVPIPFRAPRPLTLDAVDPLTGVTVAHADLAVGETFTLRARAATVLIGHSRP